MDTLGQVIARHATAVALEWGARITIFAVFVLLAGSNLAGLHHLGAVDGPETLWSILCFFHVSDPATALTRLAQCGRRQGSGCDGDPCVG
jgi:hypothetical protein